MRRHQPLAIHLLLAATCCLPLQAGVGAWTPLGPDGGHVTVLAARQDRPTAFAGTDKGGIFRSTDGGRSWSAVNTGLGSAGVYAPISALEVDPLRPARIYAGTLYDGSYRSLDGGSTWNRNSEIVAGGATTPIHALRSDPSSASTIYAATPAGVFRSRDGGASWQRRSAGLPAGPAWALAFDPTGQSLYVGVDRGGVYRSVDRGASWQRANAGLPNDSAVTTLAVDPRSPTSLLAGTGIGLYRSLDRGRSWKRAAPELIFNLLVGIEYQTDSGRVYAATERSVFQSLDRGATWSLLLGSSGEPNLTSFAAGSAALYVASFSEGRTNGTWRSDDGGATWQRSSHGLATIGILQLAFDPADPATFYASTEASLFVTRNAGSTWNRMVVDPRSPYDRVASIAVEPASPAVLYAGGSTLGPVARSEDGGASWQEVSPPATSFGISGLLQADPQTPGALWGAGFGPPSHGTQGGRQWAPIDIGSSFLLARSIEVDRDDPRKVAFTGSEVIGTRPPQTRSAIFRSEDGGLTWHNLTPATLPGSIATQLAADRHDPAVLYAATDLGLYVTRSAGASWQRLLDFQARGGAVASAPQALYAVRSGAGALRSTDQGATWVPIRNGLGGRRVRNLWIDPQNPRHLFASTENGGLWEYTEAP